MIEVLVALTVVAFGMLGLAGMQARSMSFNKDSFDRKVAAEMIEQLSERLRANFDGFSTNQYNFTMLAGDAPPALGACGDPLNCQPDELADRDWAMWTADVRRYLPVSAAFLDTTGRGPTGARRDHAGVAGRASRGCRSCVRAGLGLPTRLIAASSWTVRP